MEQVTAFGTGNTWLNKMWNYLEQNFQVDLTFICLGDYMYCHREPLMHASPYLRKKLERSPHLLKLEIRAPEAVCLLKVVYGRTFSFPRVFLPCLVNLLDKCKIQHPPFLISDSPVAEHRSFISPGMSRFAEKLALLQRSEETPAPSPRPVKRKKAKAAKRTVRFEGFAKQLAKEILEEQRKIAESLLAKPYQLFPSPNRADQATSQTPLGLPLLQNISSRFSLDAFPDTLNHKCDIENLEPEDFAELKKNFKAMPFINQDGFNKILTFTPGCQENVKLPDLNYISDETKAVFDNPTATDFSFSSLSSADIISIPVEEDDHREYNFTPYLSTLEAKDKIRQENQPFNVIDDTLGDLDTVALPFILEASKPAGRRSIWEYSSDVKTKNPDTLADVPAFAKCPYLPGMMLDDCYYPRFDRVGNVSRESLRCSSETSSFKDDTVEDDLSSEDEEVEILMRTPLNYTDYTDIINLSEATEKVCNITADEDLTTTTLSDTTTHKSHEDSDFESDGICFFSEKEKSPDSKSSKAKLPGDMSLTESEKLWLSFMVSDLFKAQSPDR